MEAQTAVFRILNIEIRYVVVKHITFRIIDSIPNIYLLMKQNSYIMIVFYLLNVNYLTDYKEFHKLTEKINIRILHRIISRYIRSQF